MGDCLTAELVPADRGLAAFAAPVGSCGPLTFGEVVFVSPDGMAFPSSMALHRTSDVDPGVCEAPASEYLGWQPGESYGGVGRPDVDTERALADWHPVLTGSVVLIGPDEAQYLAGQRWIGCAMVPGRAPYSGSLRTGSASGSFSAADAYGSCLAHPDSAGGRQLPCSVVHDAEIFGWAPVAAVAARDNGSAVPGEVSMLASCRALVTMATGMTDPSARGSLRVAVRTDRNSEAAGGGRVNCLVEIVGNSRLGGGLTWIARRPQGR